MDDLAALRLQIEWGADESLAEAPVNQFTPASPTARPLALVRPALPTPAPAVPAAILDLAALQAALETFEACPLHATASTTVAPSGNPTAGLVFIGEAPGPDDDRSGHAFSGGPGAMLDRVLASAGLDRTHLLLAHLVPWRPPGGRPVNDHEVALCLPFLHRLLALTRPRHVVLLGNGPLRALTGHAAGLRQARGRWTAVPVPGMEESVPALPMLSPDTWLKTAGNKQNTWTDLLTLVDIVQAS